MTEAEWLACTDPGLMLKFLRGKASNRKRRLFACACCRRMWALLTDGDGRRAVEVAERYADGQATDKEVRAVAILAARASADHDPTAGLAEYRADQALTAALNAAGKVSRLPFAAECAADAAGNGPAERRAQCGLVRDIFGNPFHPAPFDPDWLTPAVVGLVRAIYEDRTFDRLPILADALEEAGCDSGDVLAHCRSDGPHVRGCWVVDLVLGKE